MIEDNNANYDGENWRDNPLENTPPVRGAFPPDRSDTDPWNEVAAVAREISLMAYTSAGDPKLMDSMRMFAIWAGRLRKAIKDAA